MVLKAILAGFFIGLASLTGILIESRYVGAMVFAIGILAIIKLNLNLFTGKIGYARTIEDYFDCIIIYFSNIVGVLFVVLYAKSIYNNVWEVKVLDYLKPSDIQLLFQAFFTGMLMFVAVQSKSEIVAILAVMSFILLGGKHSIAMSFWLDPVVYIKETMLFLFGNAIGGQVVSRISEVKS